jgi:hypothetical protein
MLDTVARSVAERHLGAVANGSFGKDRDPLLSTPLAPPPPELDQPRWA